MRTELYRYYRYTYYAHLLALIFEHGTIPVFDASYKTG